MGDNFSWNEITAEQNPTQIGLLCTKKRANGKTEAEGRERERKVEDNLCSDDDYVPQKQMIKSNIKWLSVCLQRRLLLECSERTWVYFRLSRERNI